MAILDRIVDMQKRGASESQIIELLRQEGVSPKEIYEALSQSEIKSALNRERPISQKDMQVGMQPSMMQQPSFQPQEKEEIPSPSQMYTGSQNQEYENQNYYQPQSYQQYPEEYQQGYSEYYPQETNIETINDIASQIADQKIGEIKKQITSFTRNKEVLTDEIMEIKKRLDKMETLFQELQMAIIGKIGEYSENLNNIKDELRATQNSFSKVLDPLTDNMIELKEISSDKSSPTSSKKKTSKKKDNFEDYLR